jgi:hypothetical protein
VVGAAAVVIAIKATAVTTATIPKTFATSMREAAGGWGGEEDITEEGGIITEDWEEWVEGGGGNHRGGRGEDHYASLPIFPSLRLGEMCGGQHDKRRGAEDTMQGDPAAITDEMRGMDDTGGLWRQVVVADYQAWYQQGRQQRRSRVRCGCGRGG